ncbi:acyl carrier protein [Flocculibacter collagenilyticus]|uniref:acyl carrier protein n=1 Tax=Flocculibacter collagenilyticus TaxID=2744479 RepID=UPI0018F79041|nr:acyl carrier protein [Flocculibacter collagenilyticus]
MNKTFSKEELITEITDYIASKIEGFSLEQHIDTSFSRLGLDSAGHVQLTTVIEDYMQIEVAPTLAFDYPTVNALVNHLTESSTPNLEKVPS